MLLEQLEIGQVFTGSRTSKNWVPDKHKEGVEGSHISPIFWVGPKIFIHKNWPKNVQNMTSFESRSRTHQTKYSISCYFNLLHQVGPT